MYEQNPSDAFSFDLFFWCRTPIQDAPAPSAQLIEFKLFLSVLFPLNLDLNLMQFYCINPPGAFIWN